MNAQDFKEERRLFGGEISHISAEEFRYLYLCVASPMPHEICIWWEANKKKYATKAIYLHTMPAVYRFDLAILRIIDPSGKLKYCWDGKITDFGIKDNGDCQIKWFEFSNSRIGFDENFPLIDMIDYPEVIHFEVTRNCNLKCYMCRENREQEVKEIGLTDLDYALFEKTIPFAQNINNVAFFGWGEPLIHPQFDKFIDAVGRIKERNKPCLANRQKPYVNFTSNATLLTEDMIRRLIKQELNEIVVSIDSQEMSNYNFIRKNADFKQVISNLYNLKRIKEEFAVSYPALTIAIVAMRRNIEELPEMVKLAVDLGSNRMLVNYLTVVTRGLEKESLFYHQDLANRMFDITEKTAQEKKVTVTLPPRFGTNADAKGYCDDIQEMFYIRAEGTVLGCCISTDYVIGDLKEESPEDIWRGERRKKMIDNLRKGILIGKCKDCYKFSGTDINLRETHIKV